MNGQIPIKYGLYCRKSSESEDRQVLSIDSQVDKGKEIADKLGVGVKDTDILSESKSAKITNNRPAFKEMLDRIEKGQMNGVIVWHGDRLSRNAIDTALLIDLMDREKLIEIVTPSQTFRNTPIDKFMLSLTCSQAKMENDKKGIDVSRGLEKKAKMGIFPGRAPLGYMNDKYAEKGNKTIQSDPERLPLIRKMFDLVLTGGYGPLRVRQIASEQWGFRTPKGKKLGRSTIYRMLTNHFYYGRFEYPIGSGTWYAGTHEAIITEEEYDKVQYLLGRKGKSRSKKHIFDFVGTMKCGECGGSITAEQKIKRQQNGNVHSYIYYHCTKRVHPDCTQGSIEEADLKNQIIQTINRLEIPPEFHSFAIKWLKQANEKESVSRNAVVKSHEKAYKACLAKIDGLTDMRMGGEISPEEYKVRKEKLFAEKAKLGELYSDTDRRVEKWLETAEEMLTFIEHAREKFNNGGIEMRRAILSALGSNLVLKDKKLFVDLDKSLFPITKVTKPVRAIKRRLEPLKNVYKQAEFDRLCEQNPVVLGDRDSNPD